MKIREESLLAQLEIAEFTILLLCIAGIVLAVGLAILEMVS
jgi:preprotein translocase subunit SecD